MFENLRLIGSPESGIALETSERRPIANSQAPNPSADAIQKFQHLLQQHRLTWVLRKPACGRYNCFGHVWASRRTAIYDEDEVKKILQDDGYRQLQTAENPVVGDLALYLDSDRKSIYHVGMICELRQLTIGSENPSVGIPYVLSRWNDASGECLHHVNHSPWTDGQFKVDYWTDRT